MTWARSWPILRTSFRTCACRISELEPDNGLKLAGKEQLSVEKTEIDPESLSITMRVVTLVKPSVAL